MSGNLNAPQSNDNCYLGLTSVKFGKTDTICIVYMNIRSLNADLYNIEDFLD